MERVGAWNVPCRLRSSGARPTVSRVAGRWASLRSTAPYEDHEAPGTSADEPERAISSHRFIGREGEAGEGENFGGVGHEAIVGVVTHAKDRGEGLVVDGQFPAFGQ